MQEYYIDHHIQSMLRTYILATNVAMMDVKILYIEEKYNMGYYYKFYRPRDMKLIKEGKLAGMPFYYNNLPIEPIQFSDYEPTCFMDSLAPYTMVGIMNRNMAKTFQSIMSSNNTLFTDLMNEYDTDCLIYLIE